LKYRNVNVFAGAKKPPKIVVVLRREVQGVWTTTSSELSLCTVFSSKFENIENVNIQYAKSSMDPPPLEKIPKSATVKNNIVILPIAK